jgi:ribose transport system substrate-binding protein
MRRFALRCGLLAAVGSFSLVCVMSLAALAGGPDTVQGPGADSKCFRPWAKSTKYFQWKKKNGPYRIALDNGFIGNTWRIQMIKTAKAYAEQPAVKAKLKEFKVISTGEDLPAQIAAANNFIDAGYDAVIVNALSPKAFGPVAKRAKAAGVVLLSFDNVIESGDNIVINVDQVELGRLAARWLVKEIKGTGKLLEVRGPSGNSVDRDRHNGFHEVLKASGKKFEVVEVVGKWDDGTAQKATADAIAIHKKFAGIYVQGGSTGTVRALVDSGHAMIPISGETENGFRKLCAKHAAKGLRCSSAGTGPAQVAVTIKAAIAALEGEKVPQSISLPASYVEYPNIKEGADFYPNLSDNFFVGNSFPDCKIGFTAEEIMGKSEANQ